MIRHLIARMVCVLLSVAVITGCDDIPEYVLKEDVMVDLLVDIHKGEGVIDINHGAYRQDSLKKELKQSIYAKHGVTAEQVDTTLVWYGHNVEKYVELYDKVIERLESQLKDADVAAAGQKVQLAVAGDSVDTWSENPYYRFDMLRPSNILKFSYKRDENWEEGDIFNWRFYSRNRKSPIAVVLAADYSDGTSDFVTKMVVQDGWNEIILPVDTAKTARAIYGFATMTPVRNEVAYLDSISLVRKRFSPSEYLRGMVKEFSNAKKKNEPAETLSPNDSVVESSPNEHLVGLPVDSASRRQEQRHRISPRRR